MRGGPSCGEKGPGFRGVYRRARRRRDPMAQSRLPAGPQPRGLLALNGIDYQVSKRSLAGHSVTARNDKGKLVDEMQVLERVFGAMHTRQATADAKRFAEIKAQWDQFREIRDKDLLLRIGFSSAEFAQKCLAVHPARRLWQDARNIGRAFDILRASRLTLVELAGSFHARIVHGIFDDRFQQTSLNEATKEIYTYSCAASSLVQAYRHLLSGNQKIRKAYDDLRSEIFSDSGILAFFSQLRNANNHLHILLAAPHYQVSHDLTKGASEVTSGIAFDKDQIVNNSEWSVEARSFAANRSDLDVIKLVEEHFALAASFKDLVFVRTGIQSDAAYRDYGRILLARKTISTRVSLGLILQQAVPKKLNPYEYLEKWFTSDELERVYAFPDHTQEQLEFMISLRHPLGFCDQHTRR